jgi:hypothetical protein
MEDVGVTIGPDVIVRITDEEDKSIKNKMGRSRLLLGKLIAAQAIIEEKIADLENPDA